MSGVINCAIRFGRGTRSDEGGAVESECLVRVVALGDIAAGAELLTKYGAAYCD